MAYGDQWRRLPNDGADLVGTIHHRRTAIAAGFRDAVIGTRPILYLIMAAVDARFGRAFHEGGWVQYRNTAPIFEGDDVRVLTTGGSARGLRFKVETADGRACVDGFAAVDGEPPWIGDEAGLNQGDAVPGWVPGETLSRSVERLGEELEPVFVPLCDDAEWYISRSPWGPPIVPPAQLLVIGVEVAAEAIVGVGGSWKKLAIVSLAFRSLGPLLMGARYDLRISPAGTGFVGRHRYFAADINVSEPGEGLRQSMRVGIAQLLPLPAEPVDAANKQSPKTRSE